MATGFVTPRALITTDTPNVFFYGDAPILLEVTIAAAAVDARSTGETHKLQGGLTVAKITASGKYAEYDDGNSDGTEDAKGFLVTPVNTKIEDGTARDQIAVILIGHALIDETYVGGMDAAAKVDFEALDAGFLWDSAY